jgi:tRNA (guanosine-2'-O-)-methyltransferase
VIERRLASVAVVFDAPYDPHNGAAIVRSCEAFGVQALHVVERGRTPFLVAGTVARGAEKWIDLVRHANAASAIQAVRERGLELVAARADGELAPRDLATIPRLAIVVGNERDGIREELARACTKSVRVPMRGFVESLNVSVTAAILLYAATLGRDGDLSEADKLRLYARGLYFSIPRAEDVLRQ